MGSSKKTTVSYWYHPFFQLVLHEGPFDKLLEIRGGDVPVWQGEMTASGSIEIAAGNAWGGEEKEGGIEGTVDISFGEMDAQPNEFFQTAMGHDPSGHNGYALLQFNSGRYGAGNPYPKPISVLTERIYEGWLDDVCWYPEKAGISLGSRSVAVAIALDCSGSMNTVTGNGQSRAYNAKVAIAGVLDFLAGRLGSDRVDLMGVGWGRTASTSVWRSVTGSDIDALKSWFNSLATNQSQTDFAVATASAEAFFAGTSPAARKIFIFVTDGEPSRQGLPFPLPENDAVEVCQEAADALFASPGVQSYGFNIDLTETRWTAFLDNTPTDGIPVIDGADSNALRHAVVGAIGGGMGMNPAHVVYDSLTCLQGEPIGTIDEASFLAAADRLYAEGFGICTRYNHAAETIEQFRQRILDLIGAECSRYNGKWYLDLIRELSPEEIAELPVLTDDDILEWQEDPTNRDDAVNQVAVKWFDPATKQSRLTAHVHALAAINALGTVNPEVRDYPEVPYEQLANRLALRDLRNKSIPTRRLNLTTNRRPYNWRKGHAFRLQAPRRGIAEMVCRVGEIDRGTLQSGAIRLVAVQDVFAMPSTAYIVGQPPVPPPSQVPEPIEHQLLFEAPYVELAGVLSSADLAALDEDAGYVMAIGVRPGNGQGYALLTRPAAGEFERAGVFDWSPSAVVVEGAGYTDTNFTLASGSLLARVEPGTAALWGSEIVRVDALDPVTGAVTLGRGCADTVAVKHAPGERIHFFDTWAASDRIEYVAAETVEAKLLPRTGTQELAPGDVPTLDVTLDQRAARPYPPAKLRVGGLSDPSVLIGDVEVAWAHRDRVAQADQLVDAEVASVGPEPGTTYTLRAYLNDVLDDEQAGITGTTATWSPSGAGQARIELFALRDGLESWQAQVREFAVGAPLLAEDGSPITAEDGSPIIME